MNATCHLGESLLRIAMEIKSDSPWATRQITIRDTLAI